MDIILEVNKQQLITINIKKGGYLTLDDEEGLKVEAVPEGLLITPTEKALKRPNRILEYTINETEERTIYNLKIVGNSVKDNLSLPKRLKIYTDEEMIIPNSVNFLDGLWSFIDESCNSGLSLSKEGVTLKNLPVGFYTLQCEIADTIEVIEIQCLKSSDNNNDVQQVQQLNILETEDKPVYYPQNNRLDKLPEIKLPCKLQVIVSGVVKTQIRIKKTESLLIGRLSTTKAVVDLDLSSYTKEVRNISRNHLKIWYSEPHLFMKNIGSRKVLFKGMEMFPEDEAVLSDNCTINIADLILKIVKE